MSKQKNTHRPALSMRTIAVGILSVTAAFAIGIRSAGKVEPIGPIQADEILSLRGDMNSDGVIDEADVTVALELSEHYELPTPEQLRADPNQDGTITAADALAILKMIPPTR